MSKYKTFKTIDYLKIKNEMENKVHPAFCVYIISY